MAGLSVITGCYGPALRDCTVSCAAAADCAQGQVCGADGLCAAPEIAGTCAPPPDGGPAIDAARPVDAPSIDAPPPPPPPDAPPDAPPMGATLRVQIDGAGSVFVDGSGVCSSFGARGDCTYDLTLGAPKTVRAVAIQPDQRFKAWTSSTCGGQGASCTFTPTVSTTVIAKFERP